MIEAEIEIRRIAQPFENHLLSRWHIRSWLLLTTSGGPPVLHLSVLKPPDAADNKTAWGQTRFKGDIDPSFTHTLLLPQV
jgi:hypothetical protein